MKEPPRSSSTSAIDFLKGCGTGPNSMTWPVQREKKKIFGPRTTESKLLFLISLFSWLCVCRHEFLWWWCGKETSVVNRPGRLSHIARPSRLPAKIDGQETPPDWAAIVGSRQVILKIKEIKSKVYFYGNNYIDESYWASTCSRTGTFDLFIRFFF